MRSFIASDKSVRLCASLSLIYKAGVIMAAIWSIEGIINVAGETLLSARHALAVSSIKPSNT